MAFDQTTYNAFNMALIVLCILFHLLGLALLLKLWKRNAQQLMIINLSVAELITSVIRLIVIACAQYLGPPPSFPCGPPPFPGTANNGTANNGTVNIGPATNGTTANNSTGNGMPMFMGLTPHKKRVSDTLWYSSVLAMTGMFFVIFLIMIALMLDRVWIVVLKEKYHRIFSIQNTAILMALCWIVGAIMLIAFPLARHHHDYKHNYHFEYHIYTVCDVIFMVVAVVSYLVVLSLYSGYQVQEDQLDEDGKEVDVGAKSGAGPGSWSVVRTLRMSQFYIPLLILVTYFIFVILPHWIYLGEKYPEVKCQPGSRDPWRAMIQLLIIGYLSDAVVYIFLQKNVRGLLAQWLGCGSKTSNTTHPAKGVDNSAVEMS